jgi:perosamine synthetase
MIKSHLKPTFLRNYFVIRTVSFISIDIGIILLAFFLAAFIRFELIAGVSISYLVKHYSYLWLALLIRLPLYYAFGLYDRLWRYAGIAEVARIIVASLSSIILIYLVNFFVLPTVGVPHSYSYSILLLDGSLNLFLLGGSRFSGRILRNWLINYYPQNGKGHNGRGSNGHLTGTLIAGLNDAGEAIVRQVKNNPEWGIKILGFVDDNPTIRYMRVHDVPILGRYDDIPRLTDQYGVDAVIIADPGSLNGKLKKIETLCHSVSVLMTTMPTMGQLVESYVPPRKHYPSGQKPDQKRNGAGAPSIPMSSPRLSTAEVQAVNRVLTTRHLSFGPYLTEFEHRFAAYCGARHAVGVSSGTAGLHLAVIAAGIGQGDLVITTPFSFIASANCLLYEQAMPIFVDIDPYTMNIDPNQVATAAQDIASGSPRANRWLPPILRHNPSPSLQLKGILPVHVFGQQADMEPILDVTQHYGLTVIEDACEAIGAEHRGRRAGSWGDTAVFAFYPNKQMTTGEGGMIVTDNDEWADLFRSLRNQGRDVFNAWLNHSRLGYNYRMDELSAALGVVQLDRIEELLATRAQVAEWYNQRLQDMPGVYIPYIAPTTNRMSWFTYVIRLAPEIDREAVMATLKERGVPSRPYFSPIHLQSFYREKFGYQEGDFPITESVAHSTLALPFSGNMSEEQVDIVCTALQETVIAISNKLYDVEVTPYPARQNGASRREKQRGFAAQAPFPGTVLHPQEILK